MEKIIRNLIVFVFITLPFSQVKVIFLGIPVYLPEISIGIAAILYFSFLKGKKVNSRIVPGAVIIGASLFLFGSILSAYSTGLDSQELGSIKSWIFFPLLAGFLALQAFPKESYRGRILFFWFIGIFVTATVSLFPLPFIHETYDGRLASFFPSPNHFAFFLEPGVLIGIYFLTGHSAGCSWERKPFVLLGTMLMISDLFLTGSEGALVAVLVGVGVMLSLAFFSRKVIVRFGIVSFLLFFALLAVFFLGSTRERLESGEIRTSLASRVMIWNASIRIIESHPLLGIGLRNFEREYLALQGEFPPYLEWAVPHPHNIVLALWLQTGIVGLSGFLVMFCESVRFLWKDIMKRAKGKASAESIFFLSYLVMFSVHGLVDTPFFRNDLSLQLILVMALALASRKVEVDDGV